MKLLLPFAVLISIGIFASAAFASEPARPASIQSASHTVLNPSFSLQYPENLMCHSNSFDVLDETTWSELRIAIIFENGSDEVTLLQMPLEELYNPYRISKSYPDGEVVLDVHRGSYFNPFGKEFECGEVKWNWSITSAEVMETRTLDLQDCELSQYYFPCSQLTDSITAMNRSLEQFDDSRVLIYMNNEAVMSHRIAFDPGTPGSVPHYPDTSGTVYASVILSAIAIFVLVAFLLWRRR